MPITNYAEYVLDSDAPFQRMVGGKAATTTVAGRLSSTWLTTPFAGTAPTTAAVPTSATTGAMVDFYNATASQSIIRAELSASNAGCLILVDRLSHQGGLSGTVTTAQATNLPTAALTRFTSGVGVMAGLEIYTAVGATGTTVTASYTNSAGTSGRTSLATDFGNVSFNELGRMICLPLQETDAGVRAVASVTVLASTATAGAFGVTLFKPLAIFPIPVRGTNWTFEAIMNMAGNMQTIPNNACLQWLVMSSTTSIEIYSSLHTTEV